jgi:hypothetical protein
MIDKKTLQKIKMNDYVLICCRDDLETFYFCNNKATLYKFIVDVNLKYDEYYLIKN